MSLGVLAFFIVKIVPVFAEIFKSFQVKLPPLTAFIVMFSGLVVNHLAILVVAAIVGLALFTLLDNVRDIARG